jgi:hypothetical protein
VRTGDRDGATVGIAIVASRDGDAVGLAVSEDLTLGPGVIGTVEAERQTAAKPSVQDTLPFRY